MAICVIGINHKTADLNAREAYTVAETEYADHLKALVEHPGIDAAAVISTCNRTEYYLSVPAIKQFQAQASEIMGFDCDAETVYCYVGAQCAAHLFAVTAGVDSLVVGETQIQGQVKRAFDAASQIHLNAELNKLFQMAFKTAKMVRSDTEIGRNPVSVAHCAVQLGRQIFGALNEQKTLIVGSGETAELLIRYLINHDATNITVANRTLAKAEKLARHFNAESMSLAQINHRLNEFDLVFTATASPQPLITFEPCSQALKIRKYKPMVMIDLSVPRDIEDSIKKLDEVFLYSVDDLQKVIAENMQRRESTLDEARRIIEAEAALLETWLNSRRHHDLLQQYQQKVEQIKQQVVNRQIPADASETDINRINTVAHQVGKKLSHDHIKGIKKILASGNQEHIKLIAEVFNLDTEK